MNRLTKIFLFLICVLIPLSGYSKKQESKKKNIISFENGVPENWKAGNNSNLSTSTDYYKHEKSSLLWRWTNGESLTIEDPKNMASSSKGKHSGLTLWVYNKKAIDGKIHFGFTDDNNTEICGFDFDLNFSGWRAQWVSYRGDMGADRRFQIANMKITPDKDTKTGELYFDLIEFCKKIYGDHSSSFQYQRPTDNNFAWGTYRWCKYQPTTTLQKSVSKKQIADFKEIENRLEQWLYGSDKHKKNESFKIRKKSIRKYIKKGIKQYDKFNIVKHEDGRVTGKPLFARNSNHKPKFNSDISQKVCLPLALDYKYNGNVESLTKLINTLDYLHDQGWAEGSGIGSLNHESNRSAGYVFAVYSIRKELKRIGKLKRELATIDWFMAFKQCFSDDKYEITADAMRTKYMFRLLRVLAMDNTPTKVQYMQALLKWYNKGLEISTGWADVIKPDFTGYHHRSVYANGYCPQAFHNASLVHYLLHDTEFAYSKESISNLTNALLTQRLMASKYHTPASLGGRLKSHDAVNRILPAYAYMAAAEGDDNTMSSAFMRLWTPESVYISDRLIANAGVNISYFNTLGAVDAMLDVVDKGAEAEKSPNGFYSKPYAGLALHRRADWMVAAKGWSQYMYDYESGGKNNVYGRYVAYGSLQIFSNGDDNDFIQNGYSLDSGWDWNRWPGATTVNIPLKKLKCTKKGEQSTHRSFSPSTFLGATGNGHNGVWSMQLHDNVFQKEFKANKSIFCFDNEIVCLGSNIKSSNQERNTETTLFQFGFTDELNSINVNNTKKSKGLGFASEVNNKKNFFLIDPAGNGFIVPKANNLKIECRNQSSKLEDSKQQDSKTFGDYAVAWFDHGVAPTNGDYEYTILLKSTPKEIKSYAKNRPYKVLSQNNVAHIVEHKKLNSTGYAIFDAESFKGQNEIVSVTAPSLLMVKTKKNSISINLCDPDFRRTHYPSTRIDDKDVFEPSKAQKMKVVIKGEWKLKVETSDIKLIDNNSGNTTIEVNCNDAQIYDIKLTK